MHCEVKHQCPGCQQHFRPGGYTNHLKLTHDPRCKSIRNSVFQRTSGTVPHHSDHILTASPSVGPSPPTREPSHVSDNPDSDMEMLDVEDENHHLPPTDTDIDPLLGQSVSANNHHTLPDVILHSLPLVPIVIGSDMDSDSSDDDDDNVENIAYQSHQESTPPSGRFSCFCTRVTGAHYDCSNRSKFPTQTEPTLCCGVWRKSR